MACKKILIIDDDPDIRDSLSALLELEGFEVDSARNGREALEKLKGEEQPCLILLDLMMPVMDGWGFLEARKKNHYLARIPVLVATAGEGIPPMQGLSGAMRKPVDIPALLKTVETYCGDQALAGSAPEEPTGKKAA